jgi:hypothetical protein
MRKYIFGAFTALVLVCLSAYADPIDPSKFYPEYYLSIYPDLISAFGTDNEKATQHYIEYGLREGRSPNPLFDPRYYMEQYPDLRNAFGAANYQAAARHWLDYGINENRKGAPSTEGLNSEGPGNFTSGSTASTFGVVIAMATLVLRMEEWSRERKEREEEEVKERSHEGRSERAEQRDRDYDERLRRYDRGERSPGEAPRRLDESRDAF